jgi:hypothetical protein
MGMPLSSSARKTPCYVERALYEAMAGDLRDGIDLWHHRPPVLTQWKHHRSSVRAGRSHLYAVIVEHEHLAYSRGIFVFPSAPYL